MSKTPQLLPCQAARQYLVRVGRDWAQEAHHRLLFRRHRCETGMKLDARGSRPTAVHAHPWMGSSMWICLTLAARFLLLFLLFLYSENPIW